MMLQRGASLEVISTEKTFRSLTFFRENYSSLILIVVKDSLKHLHVHRRSVSVQDGFFESTELLSLYHCIRIRTQGRVLEF